MRLGPAEIGNRVLSREITKNPDRRTGANLFKRTRISHLEPPRFSARVVECDESGDPVPEEDLADLETGQIFRGDDGVAICEVLWDDKVDPAEQMEWLKRAHELIAAIETDGSSDH